jgi:hypothetical protein
MIHSPHITTETLRVMQAVNLGNNGFADFPPVSSGAREALESAGYRLERSDRVFIGGLRVYSPQALLGYGKAEPRKQDPLALVAGDFEAGCLAKNTLSHA